MSDTYIRRVSSLDDDRIDSAAVALTQAFQDDPLLLPMVGGDTSLSHALFRAYIAAAIVDGDVYFAEEGGDVVGAALWFGPGKEFLESREQREAGWDAFWARLSSSGKEWHDDGYTRLNALYSRSLPPYISKSDTYRLICLGIHPVLQCKGIGSRLIQEGKARAKSQDVPLCIHTATESGVAICKRWGFHVGGEAMFKSVWRDALVTVMTWML